ncbi:MAG: histidinol-phosphate transaminase [Dehalococcoidales bacterium]|nr:MAG: histidinol-phosphate transaminase [Dehalococcoidales bacterium]
MQLQPRKAVSNLTPGVHGGIDQAELETFGIAPGEIIDFSVCTNPAGVPPGILRQVWVKDILRYPDSQSTLLGSEIAHVNGVSENNVLVSSGSTEIIRLSALAYLEDTDRVLVVEPTYGEYRLACEIAGAEVITFRTSAEDDFRPNIDALADRIKTEKPKVIFLCNPNNPTGNYLKQDEFEKILSASSGSLVVLDEAYISFVDQTWSATDYINKANLLIMRSMTKDYSLAGLRLGYAIANEQIIEILSRICPPWSVNAIAQKAGIKVLQDKEYLEKSRELVVREKDYLVTSLEKLGFECIPSDANYFLVKVTNAAEFRKRLLMNKKILVRDCTSFGLPEYIRVAPRSRSQNRKLIVAVKELVDDK